MLALNLPTLLGFLQGVDISNYADLSHYFNRSYMAYEDTATWGSGHRATPVTGWLVRLLCLICSWSLIFIGVARWNRFLIWLQDVWRGGDTSKGEDDNDSDSDSDSSEE